ncbi:MAG: hypothetical protein M4579_002797 [Chaenotheca gracillima]|nr:MAG: hypothetical protein M4579_002797 [Chaenotheca gracillima]
MSVPDIDSVAFESQLHNIETAIHQVLLCQGKLLNAENEGYARRQIRDPLYTIFRRTNRKLKLDIKEWGRPNEPLAKAIVRLARWEQADLSRASDPILRARFLNEQLSGLQPVPYDPHILRPFEYFAYQARSLLPTLTRIIELLNLVRADKNAAGTVPPTASSRSSTEDIEASSIPVPQGDGSSCEAAATPTPGLPAWKVKLDYYGIKNLSCNPRTYTYLGAALRMLISITRDVHDLADIADDLRNAVAAEMATYDSWRTFCEEHMLNQDNSGQLGGGDTQPGGYDGPESSCGTLSDWGDAGQSHS